MAGEDVAGGAGQAARTMPDVQNVVPEFFDLQVRMTNQVDNPRARACTYCNCLSSQGYAESFIKDEHVGALARELLKNLERKFK